MPRKRKPRIPRGHKPRAGKKARGKRPVLPGQRRPVRGLVPPKPPGAQQPAQGLPAPNTTCDVYFAPNVPPAAPDVAGVACHLAARFVEGSESSEGHADFRWTHRLSVPVDADIRDSWPNPPENRVYVPDKNGTGFLVVFVELVNRGSPTQYRRAYLNRLEASFPTTEL